jgi:hypothetical protein
MKPELGKWSKHNINRGCDDILNYWFSEEQHPVDGILSGMNGRSDVSDTDANFKAA